MDKMSNNYQYQTLFDVLEHRAVDTPFKIAYTFVADDGTEESVTYAGLRERACAVATQLQEAGATEERALLLFQPGMDYIVAFWGCLYGGVIAVPAYPPRQNGHLERLHRIAEDSDSRFALTTSDLLARFGEQSNFHNIVWMATDQVDPVVAQTWNSPLINRDSLAFLQYTSGSTSVPKGVMLTHKNLLHNVQMIQDAFHTTSESRGALWLPPYHDMGLIGGILQPVYTGYSMDLMSPVSFIQSPYRWLERISKNKVTVSGGPNFAYELCFTKTTEEQRAQLDLRHWERAFTGAEPIRNHTLERFAEVFSPNGFRKEAFYPCYGLAEATLFVTGANPNQGAQLLEVDTVEFQSNRIIPPQDGQAGMTLVSSGTCQHGEQQILIVDPDQRRVCEANEVGEVWVTGASIAQGYWGKEEMTAETFFAALAGDDEDAKHYLRTGDLGFISQGELYVTGRLKDLIIVRGRNYYPQDLESAAQASHPAVRNSNGAAFTMELEGKEELILVQEIERTYRKTDLKKVVRAMIGAVASASELQVHTVVLIKPASIPKTSSGKVQRYQCKQNFLQGNLKVVMVESKSSDHPGEKVAMAADENSQLLLKDGEVTTVQLLKWLTGQVASLLNLHDSEISTEQDLTTLGMDSLAMIELSARIQKELNADVDLQFLFEEISLSKLADTLTTAKNSAGYANSEIMIIKDEIPVLSYGQEALKYMSEVGEDSGAYVIGHAFRLGESVDLASLKETFESLSMRHESLRTMFTMRSVRMEQTVLDRPCVHFEVTDCHDFELAALKQCMLDAIYKPFDLNNGPLLRVDVFRTVDEVYAAVSVHHICVDFHSLELMLRDVQSLYPMHAAGQMEERQEVTKYLPFVHWQQQMLQSEEGQAHWDFWKNALQGDWQPLELPYDRRRQANQTFNGAVLPFVMPEQLWRKLLKVAREQRVTVNAVLLAAYQLLLNRHSNQKDFLVGTTVQGRGCPDSRHAVGYFVNTLPIRAQVSNDLKFEQLLQQIHINLQQMLHHQHFPLPLLVERLRPQRDPSYSPLFQVMYNFLRSASAKDDAALRLALRQEEVSFRTGDLLWESVALEHRYAQFDLSLNIGEVDGRLTGFFEYNADLFDASTVENMVHRLSVLLEAITENTGISCSAYPLLPERERSLLLEVWNETGLEYDRNLTLTERFERQVVLNPNRIAVVCGADQMTYKELNEQANRLAHTLRERGAGRGQAVGVCLPRTMDLVVALFGVLKTGAFYVPLDWNYPKERIAFMLQDSQAAWLVTVEEYRDELALAYQGPIFCLDRMQDRIAQQSDVNLEPLANSDDLAYVIYTSGSTGKPKGVAIKHQSAGALIEWADTVYTEEDLAGVLFSTSICFDLSIFEVFVTLSLAGKVIVAENALYLSELEARDQVTLINTVPSAIDVLSIDGVIPPSVKIINLAGEPLKQGIVDRLYELRHVERVYNLYGPSEDTTYSTFSLTAADQTPVIGRPIANTRIYLLDEARQPVPIGVRGEIYLAGDGVAAGYLHQPELTRQKFVPDVFSSDETALMYRSGDIARYRSDGVLEYAGRIDHQVKLRGFRIELGEIEAQIVRIAGVHEAIVTIFEDETGNKELTVYWSPVQGQEAPSVQSIRTALSEQLPSYMIPAHFLMLPALPLTPNGKVDRKALPKPTLLKFETEEGQDVPRNETEAKLLAVWHELLEVTGIGVNDSFFRIGGHSLLLMRLLSALRERFGYEGSLSALFVADTVAKQAELLADEQDMELTVSPLVPVTKGAHLPLSSAQQSLWMQQQIDAESSAYHMSAAIHLKGTLHKDTLEASFSQVIDRHESLRTTFEVEEGQPFAKVHKSVPFELKVLCEDWQVGDERLAFWIRKEVGQAFNLQTGPLIRAALLSLGELEHVLVVTMHHIISDGWSTGVFIRELSAIYTAMVRGDVFELPDLNIQFTDAMHWQERYRERVAEKQVAYWMEQLSGTLPVLNLPFDRPRPSVQSYRGSVLPFRVSRELTAGLRELSETRESTLYMTLLSAYAVLLFRYTGQTDLVIGSPIANRNRSEIESLIGYFVNMLAMRADLSGQPTFLEMIERMKQTSLAAFSNQDVPFEKLMEELQVKRNPSYSRLFQTVFALQNAPLSELTLADLEIFPLTIDTGTSKFDLMLTMEQSGAELSGWFEYNTDLFDTATIQRFAGHFQQLLTAAVKQPDRPILELPMLNEQERKQLLTAWNASGADGGPVNCIHHIFEAQVIKHPDAVAVVCEQKSLTYRELNEKANQVAYYLQKQGIEPESLVAICMERSLDLIVGILGILKAGGAYLPLDPVSPADRFSFVLEDAKAMVLITQQHLAAQNVQAGVKVICLDGEEKEQIAKESVANPKSAVTPDSLAYVIYTSGTSGKPKGVLIPHGNVARLFAATEEWYGFSNEDVWTMFHSFAFDFSVWEIWGALFYGGRLVVVPYLISRSPKSFYELMVKERVTVMNQTPTAFLQFIHAEVSEGRPGDLNLRYVIFGGEALQLPTLRPWFEKHGDQCPQLVNMYGITETTVHVTYRPLTLQDLDAKRGSVIGKPIPDLQLYVLDACLEPVPAGVIGEIYIGGAGLARGYLNRPELTAEKFVETTNGRLYKSGDLARRLVNGELEFLGRNDDQVKIRGFRIELGEISEALTRHPSVRQAIVTVTESQGDKFLVAYVVLMQGAETSMESIRAYLKERLPDYMLPSRFQLLEEMPLTINGKVELSALPIPEEWWNERSAEYAAPSNEREHELVGIWSEILKIEPEQIGVHDSFFDLGGHSMRVTQLQSTIYMNHGIELPLQLFFEHVTVAEQASAVDQALLATSMVERPAMIRPADRVKQLPQSFAQQRLWFLDHLESDSTAYNIILAVRLSGRLQVTALERSMNEIVRRHEILRTTFAFEDGLPIQIIAAERRLLFPVTDITGSNVAVHDAEVEQQIRQQLSHQFNLLSDQLLRVQLLRLAKEEHVLVLTMHHIISDAWSLEVMLSELQNLYSAYLHGGESPLSDLQIQYADFSAWQREHLQGEKWDKQIAYWKQQLQTPLPLLQLPVDRPRPAVQTHNGALHPLRLSKELSAGLHALGRQEQTTLFMTLLSTFKVLLHRYSGQADIIVGTPIANRNRKELEPLIGFFSNTLALRTDFSDSPTFRNLLQQVRHTCLNAYSNQDVPFERIVEILQPERSQSHSPIFQAMFVLQDTSLEAQLEGVKVTAIPMVSETAKFEMTLFMRESDGQLLGELEYNTDLFDAETIDRFLQHYVRLLEVIVERPDAPVLTLPMMSEQEQEMIVKQWNEQEPLKQEHQSIFRMFETQTERTPDALAVTYGGKSWTYRELDEHSNRLAHCLQQRGVGPDVVVGLSIPRSFEMIAVLLAVFKAGGGYLPLDPAYPRERRDFMLEDSKARLMIAHRPEMGQTAGTQVVDLEELLVDAEDASSKSLQAKVTPDHLGYLIYTSGSTGRPKGIWMPQRPLANLLNWQAKQWNGPAKTLQFTTLSFDVAFQEIFSTLCTGGTLYLLSEEMRQDLEAVADFIAKEGIERLFLPYVALEHLAVIYCDQAKYPALLREVITAGEVLRVTPAIRQLFTELPHTDLINQYGPSETHVVTALRLPEDRDLWKELPPIGYRVSGAELYLLDDNLQPVPVGVAGEIYIGGVSLCDGYVNRPDLTSERFVQNPFAKDTRMYKTGDVGRYLSDGSVEYLGRLDQQVKIRGFRVELSEIEVAVGHLPDVQEAIVLADKQAGKIQRLVAYLKLRKEATMPEITSIEAMLRQRVPEFMVPSEFVVIEKWPLTPSGKVDRRALHGMGIRMISSETEMVAPRTEIEEYLGEVWCELLQLQAVSIKQNFFQVGGHSLLAIQMISQVKNDLEVEVSVGDLFASPTLEGFAARVEVLIFEQIEELSEDEAEAYLYALEE